MLTDNRKLTLRRRRWMVIGYYAGAAALPVIGIAAMRWRFAGHIAVMAFFPLLTAFAGLLGGISPGGPVRYYGQPGGRTARDGFLTRRSLTGGKGPLGEMPLDERDFAVRDRAHYRAMRIVRILVGPYALAVWFVVDLRLPGLPALAGLGAYVLFILAMTLPQAILFWTEPEPGLDPETRANSPMVGAAQ
ncbi:MAG TPA: hypothetical protein VIY53_07280 [Acidobacteriaceae bacterium]